MESIVTELKTKNRNDRSSAAIRAEIESAPIEARHCRNIYLAAEIDARDAERFCVFHAIVLKGGDFSDVIANNTGMYIKLGDQLRKATDARHLANLLASSPEVVEARAKLDPLYAELDAALAREQIEAAPACSCGSEEGRPVLSQGRARRRVKFSAMQMFTACPHGGGRLFCVWKQSPQIKQYQRKFSAYTREAL